ncbi:hypothetical protein HELRODRAFT_164959 [Helobdella robusta]|uniref:BED-type domain-containing protein n=1 Tax=Helobdella robusta TaxID=6412 RepID=T1EW04_HELRO|nr:hypothetical protein HELRODRAFT_164959 [Helobdella robusta]ESN92827.1 hypothetical protein HELRODRAFT_164959 [Helobdella robusta]
MAATNKSKSSKNVKAKNDKESVNIPCNRFEIFFCVGIAEESYDLVKVEICEALNLKLMQLERSLMAMRTAKDSKVKIGEESAGIKNEMKRLFATVVSKESMSCSNKAYTKEYKKRSVIYEYFTRNNAENATCNVCQKQVKAPTGNTSNLKQHLQNTHSSLSEELNAKKSCVEESKKKVR